MEIFTCQYENHENEAIIGFCLNTKCQNSSQYCYKCLMKVHADHHDDCTRYNNLSDLITKYIQLQGKIILQTDQIFDQIKHQIQSNIKRMEENISTLKNLNQFLKTQEYIKFKQSMNILKQYYSGEIQKKKDLFINQLNEFQEIIKQKDKKYEYQQELEKNFQIAKQLANGGKHEEALIFFDKSMPLQNMKDEILRWKGESLFYLGRMDEGFECCNKAIELNPQNDMCYNNKGVALNQLKEYLEAIMYFDEAISLNPMNDSAHYNKGCALNQLKKYQEAIEYLDAALKLNPMNDGAYNNKGRALNELKQYNEAIVCFDKAIFLNPKNDSAYYNKAYALHSKKEYQKAIDCYNNALNINQNPIFYKNKGKPINYIFC